MLLKVITVRNVWFVTIGLLIIGSNFKILSVMAVMIWGFCVLILAILLTLLLKELVTVVLFMILANLKQFVCWKIMCLMILGIYKMHVKEITIRDRAYNYYFDNLVKEKSGN